VTLSVLWVWDLAHRDTAAGFPQGITLTPAQAGASPPGATAAGGGGGSTEIAGGPSNATTGLATITPTVYVVQPGDTLGKVALEFDISVEELMAANGLTDPNVLEVGQTLAIPVGPISTLAPSDTPLAPETAVSGDTTTSPPSSTPQAGTLAPLPTSTPVPGGSGETQLAIRGVIGAGNPAEERVTIVNIGGDVSLAGWTLRDSQGNVFFFPALSLFQGGAVTVHTKTGANTVTDLYWNQTAAIWESGEQVVLADPAGVVHTTFVVP
jgi:LysM repeat protein